MYRRIPDKVLELFIPAQALEHPANAEEFNLHQKLCAAVNRHIHNGNFKDLITITDPLPKILLVEKTFDRTKLGYNVRVLISYLNGDN